MNDQTEPSNLPAVAERPSLSSFRDAHDPRALMAQVLSTAIATNFDPDAWVVMDERDSRLIEQELMFGVRSDKFVYDFDIQGTRVTGISVVGAAELASHYGGIQHRLVSSWRKVGSLFIFQQYPGPDSSLDVITKQLPDLEKEPDGYNVVVEVRDIKTGVVIQTEQFESEFEYSRKSGEWFRKPHFSKVAQSKAYRNGVLRVIPQAIQMRWKDQQLRVGKNAPIGEGVLDQKRSGVLQYAAAQGIAVERAAIDRLTFEQIAGVAEAARTKDRAMFVGSLIALGAIPADGSAEAPRRIEGSGGGPGGGGGGSGRTGTTSTSAGPGTAPSGGPSQRPARKPPVRQTQNVQREAGNPADRGAATETAQGEGGGQTADPSRPGANSPEQAETGRDGQSGGDPQTLPKFEAYILNEYGELMDQTPYRDPLAFLAALVGYSRDEIGGDARLALREQNADGIEDAMTAAGAMGAEAAAKAKAFYDDLVGLEGFEPAADQGAAEPVVIAAPEGRETWGGYVDRLRAAEADIEGADYLAWIAAQAPVFAKAPRSIIAAVRKLIAEGCQQRGLQPPVLAGGGDRDEAAVQSAIDALAHFTTANDVKVYARSGIPKALHDRLAAEGKADLVKRLETAFDARVAELERK